MKKKKGKAVSIWFSEEILRRIDLIAEEMDISRSALINQFLDERMAMYEELVQYCTTKSEQWYREERLKHYE